MKEKLLIALLLPVVACVFEPRLGWTENRPGARFVNLFKSFFKKSYITTPIPAKKTQPKPVQDLCSRYPSTVYLEGKCLLFVKDPKPFNEAKADCKSRTDGRLYRHNIENPFLFEYIFKFFPQYFDAKDEEVWTVFKTNHEDPFKVLDTSNNDADVTKSPYFFKKAKNLLYAGKCIFFIHKTGFLQPQTVHCGPDKKSYVCEFPGGASKDHVQHLW